MTQTIDIIKRIDSDFGQNADEAHKILDAALVKYNYLNNDRIIRCIIHLAEKKLDGLKKSINHAIEDPRDVMFWAEYTNLEANQTPKHIRDFNKPFESSTNNPI